MGFAWYNWVGLIATVGLLVAAFMKIEPGNKESVNRHMAWLWGSIIIGVVHIIGGLFAVYY